MRTFPILVLVLMVVAIGCQTPKAQSSEPASPPTANDGGPTEVDAVKESQAQSSEPEGVPLPRSIRVSDGAGNSWEIARLDGQLTWSYRPMTPERSSSGVYSGGEPASGVYDPDIAALVAEEVERLLTDSESHVEARMMGTVIVERTRDGHDDDFAIVDGESGAELVGLLRGAMP